MTVAIAGASGFVGKALIHFLLEKTDWQIVAFSRRQRRSTHPRLEWRQADFFSLLEATNTLQGVDKAFYMVHSMMPSASLDQGTFEDYDLLLADNFARACEQNGVQHVVYLGGIQPPKEKTEEEGLSPHLRSRVEVEEVFGQRSFAVTNARAGLIIGEDGSSFSIMRNLIERLPILVCPQWTENLMTPIDLDDVVLALYELSIDPRHLHQTYDIGGPETFTYFELLKICAQQMKRRRWLLPIPISWMALSRLWVRLISGASKELVYPLLDSLKTPMPLDESKRFQPSKPPKSYQDSLDQALKTPKAKHSLTVNFDRPYVRSVQRMSIPQGQRAPWVAKEYMRWLPSFLFPMIWAIHQEGTVRLNLFHRKICLLQLTYSSDRSDEGRSLFYITGGLLATVRDKGRLEFREVLNGRHLLVAIHDFYPALPWFIYRYTQALLHLWVMKNFERHLRRQPGAPPDNDLEETL